MPPAFSENFLPQPAFCFKAYFLVDRDRLLVPGMDTEPDAAEPDSRKNIIQYHFRRLAPITFTMKFFIADDYTIFPYAIPPVDPVNSDIADMPSRPLYVQRYVSKQYETYAGFF